MTAFTQTTFLGASIRSVSCNVGWNEQTSSINVSLVEDPDNGDSFTMPETGTPVSFALSDGDGSFTFDGIVQSWEKKSSLAGYPVWEVVVTDPREILQGCYVILNGYNGNVLGIPNLFNAYGYLENVSFGGSGANEAGMPYYKAVSALAALDGGANPSYGGPFIRFKGYDYMVDFSGLPIPPDFYRLSGDSMSIMEIVSQLCNDYGMDFLVRMITGSPSIINFVTTSRAAQPSLSMVQSYIDARPEVIQKSNGQELRNEICSAVVVGGPVQQVFEAKSDGSTDGNSAVIWPYWGLDKDGNIIIGEGIDDEHEVTVDSRMLKNDNVGDTYTFTVGELRAALHNQDSWTAYLCFTDPDKAKELGFGDQEDNNARVADFLTKAPFPLAMKDTSNKAQQFGFWGPDGKEKTEQLAAIYDFVRGYAHDYYGKKYMIKLPENIIKTKKEDETDLIITNWEPADSGYLSREDWGQGNRPLKLPEIFEDIFTAQDGKYECFVKYKNIEQYDLTKVSVSDSAGDGSSLYMKCSVESAFVYSNASNFEGPRVVITLAGPVNKKQKKEDIAGYQEGLKAIFKQLNIPESDITTKIEAFNKNSQGGLPIQPLGPSTNMPEEVCLPLKSNVETYGPWGFGGAEGKVRFEKNDSLVPWNFNGYTYMDYAANATVESAITLQQAGEMGALEIPGLPTLSLGDELITGGPNVTGIDITMGEQGVTTSYRLRTFTPTFGQFGKQNADRFQRIARATQNNRRNAIGKFRGNLVANMTYMNRMYLANRSSVPNVHTPHTAVTSRIIEVKNKDDETVYKTLTSFGTVDELLVSLNGNDDDVYKYVGFATLDSLFKPFSTNHTLDPNTTDDITRIQEPKVYGKKYVTAWSYYPFGEPTKGIAEAEDSEKSGGCDTVFLANQPSYPQPGLDTTQDDFDATDARGIALSGPLILSGWGLDIFGRPIPGYYEDDDNIPADLSSDSDDVWDKYRNNYRRRPDLWKTGPVDLVWCQIRNVWTSNPMYLGTYKRDGKVRISKVDGTGYVEVAVNDRLNNAATLADGTPVIVGSIMGEFMIMTVGCVGG